MLGTIVTLGLATWRTTSLVKDEDGPFDIFKTFRQWLGVYDFEDLSEDEQIEYMQNNVLIPDKIHDDTMIQRAISCHWCLSVWTGYLVAILASFIGLIGKADFLIVGLALSAISIIVEKGLDKISE